MKRLCLLLGALLAAGCNFEAEMDEYCRETFNCEQSVSGGYCATLGSECSEGECCAGLMCGSSGTCIHGAQLGASPAAVDFGQFPRGASAAVQQHVVVTNMGTIPTGTLHPLLPEGAPGNLSLDGTGCEGRTLAPGEQCTLRVSYLPSHAGKHEATLRVEHGSGSVPLTVALVGITGVALSVEPRSEGGNAWEAHGNGRLVSEPAGIDCGLTAHTSSAVGTCTAYFLADTQVVLSSSSATGWGVASWSGACEGSGPHCVLTVTGEAQTAALFSPLLQLSVENLDGTHGVVLVQDAGECQSTCAYARSGRVKLTASIDRFTSSPFLGWDGACASAGEALTCTLDLMQVSRVVARFAPVNRILVARVDLAQIGPDLAGADAACQEQGRLLGEPDGQYRAWLSSPTQSAAQRLGNARGWSTPWGRPFADTLEDLTAGKVFYPLSAYADTGQFVTGTTALGMDSGATCGGWTTLGGSYTVGWGGATTGAWTQDLRTSTCSSRFDILCFGTRYRTPSRPQPPAQAFLAFLSTPWLPAGGVSAADAHCQRDADGAGLTGRFQALVAPAGQAVPGRVSGDSRTCARVDGVVLGYCSEVLIGRGESSLNVTAAGEYVGSSLDASSANFVWTGGGSSRQTSSTTAADTCNSWTGGSGAVGKVGRPEFRGWQNLWASPATSGEVACDSPQRLYCIQVP